jgi:hypothetical protein
MMAGPPGRSAAAKAQRFKIELVDKGINHANRAVGADKIIDAIRQQGRWRRSQPSM